MAYNLLANKHTHLLNEAYYSHAVVILSTHDETVRFFFPFERREKKSSCSLDKVTSDNQLSGEWLINRNYLKYRRRHFFVVASALFVMCASSSVSL